MVLDMEVTEVDKIGELPFHYGQETAYKDREKLEKGEYGENIDSPIALSKKVIKIGNYYTKRFDVIGQTLDVCGSTYKRVVIFYRDKYRVIISSHIQEKAVKDSVPDLFVLDKVNCGEESVLNINGGAKSLYERLVSGTAGGKVQEWYDLFDKVIDSITVSEVEDYPLTQAQADAIGKMTPIPLIQTDLPVYPHSIFWEKKYISGCSEEERNVCWVDAYTWRVSGEGVNKVIDWYTDEQFHIGWKLTGGGGSEGTNRYGYMGKGNEHYWLSISKADLEGTVEIEFRGPLRIK